MLIPRVLVLIMDTARPLDALNEARSKRVVVELKNGRQYLGKLKSFDVHVNIVLENAEERVNNEVTRKLGMIFLRGDTIIMVSPSEEIKQ